MTEVPKVLAELERLGTKHTRDGYARFGIVAKKTFGVSMAKIHQLAKRLGKNHELAAALWDTAWYEARLLASFVDDPAHVTPAQMDRWCREFENWADCDTVCFKLFDRTPHAFRKVVQWAKRRAEFEKRAAFALLASLALHDKRSDDAAFLACLPLIENAAADDRNFVKKGVSWALRGVGRRSPALHKASVALAQRLAASSEPAARWIGRDALKDLTKKEKLQ
ncbi:MAG TPA: DNA alkylation repair protein [Thermoanaerobaculia bacterium]|nr:DNA alkylation repair protein [Thermoanaerobaculia bacterium]